MRSIWGPSGMRSDFGSVDALIQEGASQAGCEGMSSCFMAGLKRGNPSDVGQAMENPHAVLGVDSSAEWKEIRKAFHSRALERHPDKCPASEKEAATKEFQMLQEAYEILKQSAPHDHADEDALHGTAFSPAALHTFFLPRDFHQHPQPGVEDPEPSVDADVLASVREVSATWPEPYQAIIASFVHRATKKFMLTHVQSLEVGQAAAFWLRAQNAVLHIERQESHKQNPDR